MKKFASIFLIIFAMLISQISMSSVKATSEDGDVSYTKTATVVPGTVNTWDITLEVKNKPKQVVTKADIVLVLNISLSMDGAKFTALKAAATQFVDNILTASPQSRIGIVWFSEGVGITSAFSSNATALKASITALNLKTYTFLQGGIHEGRKMLATSSNPNKYMVVMSDGDANVTYTIDQSKPTSGYLETARDSFGVVWGKNVPEGHWNYNSQKRGGTSNEFVSTGYNTPKNYSASYSAIAESIYAQAAGQNIFTIGLQTGTQANDTLGAIATSNQFYSASAADLSAIYAKIANSIQSQITNAKIVDIMGDGFTITPANVATITKTQGSVGFDSASQTLTWNIGNLSEKDPVDNSYNSAKLTYRIEVTDEILGLGLPLNGTFASNKSANLTYNDFTGAPKTLPVASPMVDPTFLSVTKLLHTNDGISVIDDSLSFGINVHDTGSYNNDISLIPGETKVYTSLRSLGSYEVSEPIDASVYSHTFSINGSDVVLLNDIASFTLDEDRKDQNIVITNKEKSMPTISANKSVVDGNDNDIAERGETLTYTIHVENTGLVKARAVNIKDILANVLPYVNDPLANNLSVTIGSSTEMKLVSDLIAGFNIELKAGESADIVFSVVVKNDLDTDTIKNIANIATVGNHNPEVTIPTGAPKLVTSKSVIEQHVNDHAEPGERLDYEIVINNVGNVKATNVAVLDTLADLTDHIDNPSAGVVTIVNDGVTSTSTVALLQSGITLDLEPGKTVKISFSVKVKADLVVKEITSLRNIVVVNDVPTEVVIDTGSPDLVATKSVLDGNKNSYAEKMKP